MTQYTLLFSDNLSKCIEYYLSNIQEPGTRGCLWQEWWRQGRTDQGCEGAFTLTKAEFSTMRVYPEYLYHSHKFYTCQYLVFFILYTGFPGG